MPEIADLQAEIDQLWARTALGDAVRVQTGPQGDGSPHVEAGLGGFDIVTEERGLELDRQSGLTLAEAAHWYLEGMATGHAQAAELRDRTTPTTPGEIAPSVMDDGYSRWNWMAPAIEIMGRISAAHGDKIRACFREVLTRHPLAEYERRNARWPLPDNPY